MDTQEKGWSQLGGIGHYPHGGGRGCLNKSSGWKIWERAREAEEPLCSTSGWDSVISHFSFGSDIYSLWF